MKTVLFLCTGNYYRSRFAEEVFNHRAERGGLLWKAYSRGLAIERGIFNVGPLSPYAVTALAERGIVARRADCMPQQCIAADLEAASYIIALKESEHRPLLLGRFRGWESRVEFWHTDDVEDAPPAIALSSIADQIASLLKRLHSLKQ